ncbi:hypothetical protein [Paenibacillus glycanilyticus]|uniref:PD-(D/E)XK endonuclease-like domain-containing protein n=1 Tax=Paenibacillus glycanilyticus TaxID=126569 RepID=A0ABQ6G9Z0_9BACL|nr:hypothetical protein [Paenibacillus glycanilyticus]GLX67437.1 hypothetical protein MU1_17820 [Paenibacillus glycanilyticus]
MNAAAKGTVIEDYKLEELLRCPYRYAKRQEAAPSAKAEVNWMQLAQLAVSYVVNAFYTTPAEERSRFSIPEMLERWWTNKVSKFESPEHYWSVKQQLIDGLSSLFVTEMSAVPIILFEQHQTVVPELQAELVQIFQLVLNDNDGEPADYIVRKYIVDEDEDMILLFQHLTAVFCSSAFGRLPSRIEVFPVLGGKSRIVHPTAETLRQSMDYMNLAAGFMPEADSGRGPLRKAAGSAECRRCPFIEECAKPPEAAEALLM